jgi:hypothetical protein
MHKITDQEIVEARLKWWGELTLKGDAQRRPALVAEAFEAGWKACAASQVSDAPDWNAIDPVLEPPFNTWPAWAVHLDIEIADLIGDVGAAYQDDTSEGRAELDAYEAVRAVIARMVADKA